MEPLDIQVKMGYDCFDSALVSVLEWLKKPYQLLFIDEWDFSFDEKRIAQFQKNAMLETIEDHHNWELLKEYHGVAFLYYEANSNKMELVDQSYRELLKKIPVLASLDLYWCEWYAGYYLTIHYPHEVIITCITKTHVIVKDNQFAQNGIKMKLSDFTKALNGIGFFDFQEPQEVDELWKTTLKEKMTYLVSKNKLNEISLFGAFLCNFENLKKQITEYDGPIFNVPIIIEISSYSMKRKQFAQCLTYLGEKQVAEKGLLNFAEEMVEIASLWSSVLGMVCKVLFLPEEKKQLVLSRIKEKIESLCIKEQELASELLSFIDGSSLKDREKVKHEMEIESCKGIDYEPLEISNLYNSNGISEYVEYDSPSEFTSDRRYIVIDPEEMNGLKIKKEIPFITPYINRDTNDHISCFGEEIDIAPDFYCSIYFVCCADMGEQVEEIIVRYEDDFTEKVQINVPAWIGTPNLDKLIYANCFGVTRNDELKQANRYPFPGYLYIIDVSINSYKKLKTVILPICPNVHIFAITVAKYQ